MYIKFVIRDFTPSFRIFCVRAMSKNAASPTAKLAKQLAEVRKVMDDLPPEREREFADHLEGIHPDLANEVLDPDATPETIKKAVEDLVPYHTISRTSHPVP